LYTLTTLHLYSKNNFFSALADLYNNYYVFSFFFLLFESSIFDQGKNYSIFEKIEIEI